MNDMVNLLDATAANFEGEFTRLLARGEAEDRAATAAAEQIVVAVRTRGDAALVEYTARLDRRDLAGAAELALAQQQAADALAGIDPTVGEALRAAAERIHDYHRRQVQDSWEYQEADGTRLGQRISPLERVGIYVPGGRAAYPSSVLMNAIPARVAGVGEIIMAVPAPGGELNPAVLAAAALAGVDRVFTVGGAQAIAALAYGTETVPAVDKIVGPGNRYVAAAKRLVYGQVGVDMIAGPSEVAVICDDSADPEWVVMDLFAQAEHDERAQAIAISDSAEMIAALRRTIAARLPTMARRDVIQAALSAHGALIQVADVRAAAALANRIAPEHLELMVANPRDLLPHITHAGAIFVGALSAEALGDYCVGPNHVLPTAGAARFSSPLGVYDFQKRSSIIELSAAGAARLAPLAATLARCEGLDAHARAAEYRADVAAAAPGRTDS